MEQPQSAECSLSDGLPQAQIEGAFHAVLCTTTTRLKGLARDPSSWPEYLSRIGDVFNSFHEPPDRRIPYYYAMDPHTCQHCQRILIRKAQLLSGINERWPIYTCLKLPHSKSAVQQAIQSGCPFFLKLDRVGNNPRVSSRLASFWLLIKYHWHPRVSKHGLLWRPGGRHPHDYLQISFLDLVRSVVSESPSVWISTEGIVAFNQEWTFERNTHLSRSRICQTLGMQMLKRGGGGSRIFSSIALLPTSASRLSLIDVQ